MFGAHDIFWSLLIVIFIFLGLKASVRKVKKNAVRDYPRSYFEQSFFCLIALGLANLIEHTFFEDLISIVTTGETEQNAVKWLLFPAMLLLIAYIQRIVKKEKKDETVSPSDFYRNRGATK